jgi:N-acetyltransferase 10
MTMDVHARYRTSSHDSVVARFNERFILSLGACKDCLVLDDELNVLPISKGKDIVPIDDDEDAGADGEGGKAGGSAKARGKMRAEQQALKDLQESLSDTKPAGDLVKLSKTTDQAQAILTFIEAIAEKTLSSTVTLTAARGWGKSAALGLVMALTHPRTWVQQYICHEPESGKLEDGFRVCV